jgi:glycerophosphoryl diester phosphodiesterase
MTWVAGKPFEIVAHRGVRTNADPNAIPPENTMASFKAAEAAGVAIETDVIALSRNTCAVGETGMVLHHDDNTGRMFTLGGSPRRVRTVAYDRMKSATLNVAGHEATVNTLLGFLPPGGFLNRMAWKARKQEFQSPEHKTPYKMPDHFRNETVPSLETLTEEVPHSPLYLELKTYDREVLLHRNNRLEERLVRYIQQNNLFDRVKVLSFSPLSLRKVKTLDPRIQTGLDVQIPWIFKQNKRLLKGFVDWYVKKFVKVDSFHPTYKDMSTDLVNFSHRADMPIAPWVYHETRQQEKQFFPKLLDMGADGAITNSIDLLQAEVNRRKPPPV